MTALEGQQICICERDPSMIPRAAAISAAGAAAAAAGLSAQNVHGEAKDAAGAQKAAPAGNNAPLHDEDGVCRLTSVEDHLCVCKALPDD